MGIAFPKSWWGEIVFPTPPRLFVGRFRRLGRGASFGTDFEKLVSQAVLPLLEKLGFGRFRRVVCCLDLFVVLQRMTGVGSWVASVASSPGSLVTELAGPLCVGCSTSTLVSCAGAEETALANADVCFALLAGESKNAAGEATFVAGSGGSSSYFVPLRRRPRVS